LTVVASLAVPLFKMVRSTAVQRILAVAVSALAVASALPISALDADWSAFKLSHRRMFSTASEEAVSRRVFRDNVQYINNENAKNHTYTLGVTQFTDMTTEQFEASYFPTFEPDPHYNATLGLHVWKADQDLPAAVDWQAAGATNPIQDENLNGCFGACYAFAAAGALEAAYKIKSGKLVAISEQQLVDCSSGWGNMGCQGGLMNYAYNYAIHANLCSYESYPYHGPTVQCQQCREVALPQGTVTTINGVQANEQSLMSAVAQQPVSVGLDGAWADTNAFRFYKSGVLSTDCGQKVDHGVLVVGYGTDPAGGAYWKIRNSYGTRWGMDGYALLARGKSGAGECGLLQSSMSYPVV